MVVEPNSAPSERFGTSLQFSSSRRRGAAESTAPARNKNTEPERAGGACFGGLGPVREGRFRGSPSHEMVVARRAERTVGTPRISRRGEEAGRARGLGAEGRGEEA